VGASIVFEVTPVASSGVSPGAPAQSAPAGPVLAANTAPSATAVTITGVAEVGQVLTGSHTYGDADGDPEGTSTFRWLLGDVEVVGATASTYTLVAADAGASVVFEVTPVASSGVSPGAPAQSAPAGPVLPMNTVPSATAVTITGVAEVGQELTGSYTYGDADGDPEGPSTFRWLRDDVAVVGATATTYTLVGADVGASVVFEVTPVATSGVSPGIAAESAPAGPVLAGNTAPSATAVAIVGTAQVGETLSGGYTYFDADGDAQGISTFRWLRNGSAISGATGTAYTLIGADEAASIVFEVTPVAVTGMSPGAPVQSAAVGPVQPAPGQPFMLEVRVAASSDDAEQDASGGIDITSSDLELVDESSNQTVGMRFNAVTIPRGATITNANIQFQVDEADSGPTSLTIRGQAADNAPTFTTANGNISSRSTTASSASWSVAPWTTVGQAGPNQQTPDIASIIQEIVNRPGWSSGNSLVIIVTGSGARTAEAYNGAPAAAPLLRVDYSGGSSGNSAPTASNVAITGTTQVGQTLSGGYTYFDADVDAQGTSTNRWLRDGSAISGANGTSYTLVGADESALIAFEVTPVALAGTSPGIMARSAEVGPVVAAPEGSFDVLVGAGDIARCGTAGDEHTAGLLDAIPGTVFTTGDNAYPDGTAANYAECYEPTWGRHKSRTRPTPGNHDYHTTDAQAYFEYFGDAAGSDRTGYYSYDLGEWHVISLNSEIDMDAGSPQEQWLRADLAAHPRACTVAYWHEPRFSSGENHGSSTDPRALWRALYEYGVELVLNGHEHLYERFAPQTPEGALDQEGGIRQFTVGTGGAPLYRFSTPLPNSEARNDQAWGVLKLSLYPGRYSWEFVPVPGATFTDSGETSCHN